MSKDINRLDANETAFFQRQIEQVKRKTYDKKYKTLRYTEFLPISTEHPSGTPLIVWVSYSKFGRAKIIADYAKDFPRVDMFADENTSQVRGIGLAYGYSIREIRQAQLAGVQLTQRKASMCRQGIEEKLDDIAWNGDAEYGLVGLFNYPGVTEYAVPDGASTNTEWTTKTPDEINADLVGIRSSISVPTKGKEVADTILLPRTQYDLISNVRMTDGNSKTVKTFFLDNNPDVMIGVLDELAGAGTLGEDRFYAYVRDSDHLTYEIPQMFEQFPTIQTGAEWEIPCHAESGGLIIYYEQSVAFGDGI